MNLQVCIPYQKCPFNCPMCIAKDPHIFDNIYALDAFKYFNQLKKALTDNYYREIVLTGDTEPSLDLNWLDQVASAVKIYAPKSNVEIQTHNYNWSGNENVDVNAFSVTTVKDALNISKIKTNFGINRLVVLGSKPLIDYLSNNDIDFSKFTQLTFKLMQPSNSKVDYIDKYINENLCSEDDIRALIKKLSNQNKLTSIFTLMIDKNCQVSYNRYKIFRENGSIYDSWEDK